MLRFINGKGAAMTYVTLGLVGVVCIVVAFMGLVLKKHITTDIVEHLKRSEIVINCPGIANGIKINASAKDREIAWEVYAQINTRIAAVDFNDDYDCLLLVNKSLHTLFGLIREKTTLLPLSILADDDNSIVAVYLSILNIGIRPYLSKWHIPVSQWVENCRITDKESTLLQIESIMPNRNEALEDIHKMNMRMRDYSAILLQLAKGKKSDITIGAPIWQVTCESAKSPVPTVNEGDTSATIDSSK